MSWIGRRLFGCAPALAPQHAEAVERYRNLAPVGADADIRDLRFVVVDVETSGLDARRDRLLAIGAVAVRATLIRLDDSYHALLRQELTSAHENILVHGIDGTSQVSAPAPTDGLIGFLEFAGAAPLVAFHSDFDRTVIERAMREMLGSVLTNPWLDVALLAPALLTEHGPARTLDDWTGALGIEIFRRHDAVADALATAQLFQIVLARSIGRGAARLSDLVATAVDQRWLQRLGAGRP